MADAPSQSQDKFIVRLPDGMRDRIKAAADQNNRSMNAEIILALECWLNDDPALSLNLQERKEIEEIRAELESQAELTRDLLAAKETELFAKLQELEERVQRVERLPKD